MFKLFTVLGQLNHFIIIKIYDLFMYIKNKEWEDFPNYGIDVYVGMFGKGKTTTMVEDAYKLLKKYNRKRPQVSLLTNITCFNLPPNTNLIEFTDLNQMKNLPPNTIVLFDEIQNQFNARNWSKVGIAIPVLGVITQVRKEKCYLMTNAQRFLHIDKQFRDLTFTVRVCNLFMKRWQFVTKYDAYEYEKAEGNREFLDNHGWYSYIQTKRIREQFDTSKRTEIMKYTEYKETAEILAARGDSSLVNVNQLESGRVKKAKTKLAVKLFGGVKNS